MQTSIFFPYSWHIDEEETEVTSIRVYGLNDKNKNICLRIDDFNPFVYIELPPEKSWNLSNGQLLMNKINELLGNKKPISCKLAWKKKLYGAYLDNKKERKVFPYLYCTFSNRNDIKTLCYKLKHNLHIVGLGSLKFKVHETDADPILQFTCCRNIPTAGWIKFHGKEVTKYDKITLCDQEFKVKWQHVFPEQRDGVAKPKIMGFDIEVNSTNPSAMPKAEKMGDKVFQISCVLARDGDNPNDYEKYLLTLGQPDQDIVGEDVLVQMFDTEAQLLEGFTTFIREENPNIIVGYNILGFDIPYMIARAKMNMCIYEFDKQGFHKFAHAKERIIKWSSSAYKNQEFEFLDAEGRVYVDLLPLIRRDFKFNNYKLKTISEYFIGETKDPLTAKGIFKCYRIGIKKDKNNEYSNISQRAMAIVGKYCFCENTLVSGKHGNIPIQNLYGQNIDVLSWNEKTDNIELSNQTNFFDNGRRECIELELEDGRTIRCTPEHKLATENGWENADNILIGNNIKVGPILPTVELDTKETIYARILGYMITDGHISEHRCVAYVGNFLDAQLLYNDIHDISGYFPKIRKDKNCWVVPLPKNTREKINQENWVIGGNRTNSNETLPNVSSWSKPEIREFLAGMFGGDGWSPSWAKKDDKFTPIGFTQSRTDKEVIEKYMNQLVSMLKMFDFETKFRITKRSNLYIATLKLKMADIDRFVTTIGYRYCYHKTIRASIATMYYRIRNKTILSHKKFYEQVKTSDLSIAKAYESFVSEYRYPPLYGTMKSWCRKGFPTGRPDLVGINFPKVGLFLAENNLKNFFIGDDYHTYSMDKNTKVLPVFSLKLMYKKSIGVRQVYDITVKNTHSLLADGIVAHNCVQDSILVVRLMEKLKTWVGLTEMATVCNVPIFTLYTQGQQIKVFSQLYKYCMYEDIVVEKDAYEVSENERYVGAKVFPPIPGRYKMVVPFDFASLYPTTIIAYNIDYHTWVPPGSDIPDSMCHVMEWSDHYGCEHDPKVIRKIQLNKYIDAEKEELKKLREKRNSIKDKLRKKEIMDEINTKNEELKPYIEERSELTKTITKHPMCAHRKYRFLKEPRGVLPTVIQNCLDARKHTRKVDMKKCKQEIERLNKDTEDNGTDNTQLINAQKTLLDVLDKRQLAFKVSANSMYGAMGVRRGYLPFMPGAMCTTYMGRTNIEIVAKTIPEKFGGELVYGDTDTCLATTPVLILKNDNKYYTTLENLSAGDWKKTVTGKEISSPKDGIKVWSDQGFTEIKYVMRHAIKKPMIKVTTHTGTIVCTLDHSLLWENGEPALGSEIKLKDKLCHRSLPLPDDTPKEPVYPNNLTAEKIREYVISSDIYKDLSAELAFVWGVFFADGSCGSYSRQNQKTLVCTWAINKKDQLLLERCMNILIYHEPTVDFKILDTMKSSHVNKLVAKQKSMKKEHKGTIKAFVEKYRELFYDNRKYKKVPDIVLNAPYSIREAFFMGYYAGDGSKKDPALTITNKGEIGSAGLFFLLRSIGYQVSINTRGDKPDTYKLTGSTPNQKFRYAPNAVKKIEPYEVEEDEYIYDIETSNHHFAAGVGQMVVHNSNYIHFPHLTGAQETWDHALYVASEVTKLFPKPIELEFEEEIYAFFFILSKKRYMYRKCLRDGIVDKKIGKKGVLLARRDNSKFIRDIYESVISKIADDVSRDDILYYVINEINEMCSGVKPVSDFIVTKSVGDNGGLMVEPFVNEKGIKKAKVGDYTVPILSVDKKEREEQLIKKGVNTEDEYYLSCLPAQVQLAERMRRRGQRVDAGTRLEYVVCDPDNHTGKQYEKLESAEYLIKHKEYINIDYMYYLKALINPLDQVLDVAYGNDNDYKKGFIDIQYKQRWKIRHKFMEQLKDLFRPNLVFKD